MPQSIRYNKLLIFAHGEAERLCHDTILPEHLLLAILRLGEGSAYETLTAAGLNPESAKTQLDEALATEPEEMVNAISRSAAVERIIRISETVAREQSQTTLTTRHLLLAILRERINGAAAYLNDVWGITYASMVETTPKAGANIDDNIQEPEPRKPRPASSGEQRQPKSATPMLDKYSRDLSQQAKDGTLDPVVGREVEIERAIQILARRKKNNPILIGEPGVGKSAIVEGLALRLTDKRIVSLDIASMVAGTTYRGQFEERIKNLISELRQHPEIILFIDEIHTLIGAGNASGSLDAANILKPALARGEVQCIGATTTAEYAKTIEKDGALERRFQRITVRPATKEHTLMILEQLAPRYADYHHVHYSEEVLQAIATLAERYITDRAFPDKAIDVMDEVGAKHHGNDNENDNDNDNENKNYTITTDDVAHVVSAMTQVPVQRVQTAEHEKLLHMAERLRAKVIGQDEAVETVVKAIQRSRLGLRDPHRPIGTFFFLGPTGVGKTHLAQCLAEEMFGSRDALIRFDMSEFTEKHTASLLVGAPPGYIAHEDGGRLTEAVRRKPYSIVLFDEIEKAHPDIFNVMLQILDEGRLTDRQGRQVDFRNTIIILTSNVGTRALKDFGAGVGFDTQTLDNEAIRRTLMKALDRTFPPEFVNRIDNVITFSELNEENLLRVLDLELQALYRRLAEQGYSLNVGDSARRELIRKGDRQYGARPIRRAIATYLEDRITEQMLHGEQVKEIQIENL